MLEFDPKLIIFTAALFLLLIAILNKILYKPMLNFMDARDKSIKNNEEKAGQNSNDVDKFIAQANEILVNAKNEANLLKKTAYNDAKNASEIELNKKKAKLEAEFNEFCANLDKEKDEFGAEILANFGEFQNSLNKKISKL